MAINPSAEYPSQVDTSDSTGYPYGNAQNEITEGDGTGFPLEKTWVSDLLGFQQALLVLAGITPSGTPDKAGASDYVNALRQIFQLGSIGAIGVTVSANQNNYAPTGWDKATVVRVSTDADGRTITGFAASVVPKILINVGGHTLVLSYASGSSSAGNQILTVPTGINFTLSPGESCLLWHDTGGWAILHANMTRGTIAVWDANQYFFGGMRVRGASGIEFTPVDTHNRSFPASMAILSDPSKFTIAGGTLQFTGTGNYACYLPLNGKIWSNSILVSFAARLSFSSGDGTFAFYFFSTDLFGGDVQTHETVAVTTSGSNQTKTLTVSPAVDFTPYSRLYYLAVSVTGQTSGNMNLFSFEEIMQPVWVQP